MKTKSVKFNYIMNTLLMASSILFPLITFPYVSRILHPVGTGKVAFATSVITYFSMFAQLGIPTYGIRETARLRDNKEELTRFVHEILIINFVTCAFVYTAFFLCVNLSSRLRADQGLFVIMSGAILFNTIGMEWLYRGLEQYAYITIRSIIFKFIALVCMFLLVRQEGDTTVYGLLTVLASVGSNIFNLFHAHRYIKMKPVGGLNFKRHFKPILVFFFMSVATTIYTNLDNVMLGFMKNDEEVGYYNAAIKIKSALVSLVASLGTVLLPRASYYIKNNQIDGFNAIARKAIHFTLLISFPLTVYFCEFSRDCILLLSGSQYLPAIAPMIIIMPTIIFIGLTNIIGLQIFIPLGMEKLVLFSVLGGAVVDFIINYFLIPLFSSSGAAIGTLVAEFVVLIIQYFGGHENTEGLFKGISFWKIMVSLLASAAVSYGISYLKLGSFLILLASAAVFFAVYTILLLALKESMVCILFNDFFHKLKGN